MLIVDCLPIVEFMGFGLVAFILLLHFGTWFEP